MKILWNEAKEYFKEYSVLNTDLEIKWFEYIWEIMDKNKFTTYYNDLQKLNIICDIRSIAIIFIEFYNLLCEDYCEIYDSIEYAKQCNFISDTYCDIEEEKDFAIDFIQKVVENNNNIEKIFSIFKETIGINTLFASLYFCINMNNNIHFNDDIDEIIQEDNEKILYNIINSVKDEKMDLIFKIIFEMDINKIPAYSWLSENMS